MESKSEAKNYLNNTRQKILEDINKKRITLEKEIDDEINATEREIIKLKNTSVDKINKIAIETSSQLLSQLIGVEVNNSSVSAIVEDQSRRNKELQNDV